MSPWIPKAIILAATVAMFVIRAPHGKQSRAAKIAKSYKGPREKLLLALAGMGFSAPLVWLFTPVLSFAEYPPRPSLVLLGSAIFAAGLWLFHLAHRDLGRNWSVTLEVREEHRLITHGIYQRIRHPMYAALFVMSIGQLLVLPNWVAGPAFLIPFAILFALRVGAEERMMRETFGGAYDAYAATTKRLVPGVW